MLNKIKSKKNFATKKYLKKFFFPMSLSSIPFESAPPQLKQDIQGFDNNIENELQKVSALKSILQELHENFNNNSQLMDNILKSATELSNVETKVRLITNEAQSAGELFHNV